MSTTPKRRFAEARNYSCVSRLRRRSSAVSPTWTRPGYLTSTPRALMPLQKWMQNTSGWNVKQNVANKRSSTWTNVVQTTKAQPVRAILPPSITSLLILGSLLLAAITVDRVMSVSSRASVVAISSDQVREHA